MNYWQKLIHFEEYKDHAKELQYTLGSLLLAYFVWVYGVTTSSIVSISSVLEKTYFCPAFNQHCEWMRFLEPLPYGYSQTMFYAGVFVIFLITAHAIIEKKFVNAYTGLLLLFLLKIYYLFATVSFGNYDYYDLVLLAVMLFLPYRRFFVRLAFVTLYFLAATIKIHEGWYLGQYFTSLQNGLPIFGTGVLAIVLTQLVIVMQMIDGWFLLSKKRLYQQIAFCYFLLFHLYSILLVAWRYPVSDLPILITLFYLFRPYDIEVPKINRSSLMGYAFILCMFVLQAIAILIPGDQKLTLEGNYFGLYMFEANHQCVISFAIQNNDGTQFTTKYHSDDARNRCDPYKFWFTATRNWCLDPRVLSVKMVEDHSINGGPFYRIVDEENICAQRYSPFTHNTWIKRLEDNPEIVGYPKKNFYY